MPRSTCLLTACLLAVTTAACSSGGTNTTTAGTTGPTTSGTGAASGPASGPASGAASGQGCEATRLEVDTVPEDLTLTGPSEWVHVGADTFASFSLANYPLSQAQAKEALRPGQLEPGQVLVFFSLQDERAIEAGTTYDYRGTSLDPEVPEGDVVTTLSIWITAGRAIPVAPHRVTVTHVDDERICGRITPQSTADAHVEGPFQARRVAS